MLSNQTRLLILALFLSLVGWNSSYGAELNQLIIGKKKEISLVENTGERATPDYAIQKVVPYKEPPKKIQTDPENGYLKRYGWENPHIHCFQILIGYSPSFFRSFYGEVPAPLEEMVQEYSHSDKLNERLKSARFIIYDGYKRLESGEPLIPDDWAYKFVKYVNSDGDLVFAQKDDNTEYFMTKGFDIIKKLDEVGDFHELYETREGQVIVVGGGISVYRIDKDGKLITEGGHQILKLDNLIYTGYCGELCESKGVDVGAVRDIIENHRHPIFAEKPNKGYKDLEKKFGWITLSLAEAVLVDELFEVRSDGLYLKK